MDKSKVVLLVILVVSFLLAIALGIVDFIWLFGPNHRRLIDYWVKTYVVDEARDNA
jgi:uncharacterized RDD family membrane protein YckC